MQTPTATETRATEPGSALVSGHRPLQRNWPIFFSDVLAVIRGGVAAHQQLVEASLALAGPAMEPHYREFCEDPRGKAILRERPRLVHALANHGALAELPEDTLGRAYLDYVSQYRFDAKAFEAMTDFEAMGERLGWDDEFAYVLDRGAQMHDLWHVLGGWGPDMAGETGVMAFTNAVVPNPGTSFVCWILRSMKLEGLSRRDYRRFISQAEDQGIRSHGLMTAPYEELLGEPLADVRAELGLLPPDVAHPGGVPYVPMRGRWYLRKSMDTQHGRYEAA